MMPNTALMALMCSLALLRPSKPSTRPARWDVFLAFATVCLSAATLLEYGLDIDFGIDRWLLPATGSSPPARPVPHTAFAFLLLGIALLAAARHSPLRVRLTEAAALLAASIASIALLGLIFNAQALYRLPLLSPSGMSLPAMLEILALAAGVMGTNVGGPMMKVLLSGELGGVAARRQLAGMLAIPLLAVVLHASVTRAWLGGATALALGVFVALAVMAASVVGNAARLNRSLLLRNQEIDRLRQATAVFESSNEGILITDAKGSIVNVNRAYENITGYAAHEAIGRNPSFQQSGRHDLPFYQHMWAQLAEAGAWQGEIWNRRRDGEIYAAWQSISAVRDDKGNVTHYVSMLSDITPIKAAEKQLHYTAHHDSLTKLPNRLLFTSMLEHAISRAARTGQQLALLFIDLDHFKIVNDTLGHPAGDQLLQAVATRLEGALRSQDLVARLGGDEFTVLLEDIHGREDAALLSRKLIDAIGEPVLLDGRDVVPSASVGIAVYPLDASSGTDLTRAADAALYRAKATGRHTFAFYTEELTRMAAERLAVEARLRLAVEAGELLLHYQPQFDLASGALVGLEALVRWQQPGAGLLLPARFVPIAEESRLIQVVSRWVIREACRQGREWLDQGLAPRRIAVNISGREFLHDHVLETFSEALRDHGLDSPQCGLAMEAEVTETVLHAGARSASLLQSLRDLGVRVSIDDFGTGYSSLALLKQLPIDALKIDQLFVGGLPDDGDGLAITRAIIAMAHSLGLEVLAEGVETQAQHDCLIALGCDQIQGYLTGKPLDAGAASDLMRRLAAKP